MRVSDKNKTALYKTISDPIMDLRVEIATKSLSYENIDERLFRLETALYNRVKTALNIKG